MENEKKFVDGLFVNDISKAPDFYDAKLGFTSKFIEFYNNNCDSKGNLRIDIKTSKGGKQYAEKDDWKPESINNYSQTTPNATMGNDEESAREKINKIKEQDGEIRIEDIPF